MCSLVLRLDPRDQQAAIVSASLALFPPLTAHVVWANGRRPYLHSISVIDSKARG